MVEEAAHYAPTLGREEVREPRRVQRSRPMKLTTSLAWTLLAFGCGGDKDTDSNTTTGETTGAQPTTGSTATTGDISTTAAPTTDQPTTTTGSSSTGELPPAHPDTDFCALDGPASSPIAGEAPFGAFSGSAAWFEWQFCNGYYPLVIVVEDAAVFQDAVDESAPIARGIAISLAGPAWEHTAATGELTPWVFTIEDGEFVELNTADGQVDVTASVSVADTATPDASMRVVGTFSIQDPVGGWDMAGTFDAAYCGPLNNLLSMSC